MMAEALSTRGKSKGVTYLVDDDDLFRESIERNLLAAGFTVKSYRDGRDLIEELDNAPTFAAPLSIILLDWKMPGINGIEVLRQLRERGIDLPVIFLTVLGDQIYEEAALAGGAVDFIEKSRSFTIVQKRIELILSGLRSPGAQSTQQSDSLQLGSLALDADTRRAYWKGKDVGLTLTEFRLVRHMAERAGRDVSYRALYDLVHGEGFAAGEGTYGYRANVRAFIKRIRQKFRAVDADFDAIGNYAGFGYRWGEEGDKRPVDGA